MNSQKYFIFAKKMTMPTNKNAFIRHKYLDRLLSDRHHYYDINNLTKKVHDMIEQDGLPDNMVKGSNDTYGNIEWKDRDEVQRQIEELPTRIATSVDFICAVHNGDRQVAQITFNDGIINIVAGMLEEKTEFVQTYFANPDFQNCVNARVLQAAVSRSASRRL